MTSRRVEEVTAMAMIGDGVLGLLAPVEHCRLWQAGPGWWSEMIEPFVKRPTLTRCLAAVEFGLGVWLGLRAENRPA
jgi:hypothetical protein